MGKNKLFAIILVTSLEILVPLAQGGGDAEIESFSLSLSLVFGSGSGEKSASICEKNVSLDFRDSLAQKRMCRFCVWTRPALVSKVTLIGGDSFAYVVDSSRY